MKDIVIFGTGQFGALIAACLAEEYGRTVAAFTVDRDYMPAETFRGLPVIPFDELPRRCAPDRHDAIIAVGYAEMNRTRATKMEVCAALGYRLISYVSPRAIVPASFVPEPNVIVFEGAVVQRFATVGAGTVISPCACVSHNAVLENAVFVGPGATVCGGTHIGPCAFIGAGAVIRDFLTVGEGAVVGAGSTLLRDLPADALCNAGESPVALDTARYLLPWPPKTKRREKTGAQRGSADKE